MNIAFPSGLGAVIAILVLVACFVLLLIGTLPLMLALLVGGCALARLV